MTKITLKKPIQAHDAEVKELTLREPTGADIVAAGGLPYHLMAGDGADKIVHLNAPAIRVYIAVLADIPPSAVDTLSAKDWATASNVVVGFFGD